VDLEHYRELRGRWRSWENVVEDARALAIEVLDVGLGEE
jgi:hypothetical protein